MLHYIAEGGTLFDSSFVRCIAPFTFLLVFTNRLLLLFFYQVTHNVIDLCGAFAKLIFFLTNVEEE